MSGDTQRTPFQFTGHYCQCPQKDVSLELFMMLARVASCLVGLDTARPEGRVYSRLADEAGEMLKRYGPVVGAAPEWWGGK